MPPPHQQQASWSLDGGKTRYTGECCGETEGWRTVFSERIKEFWAEKVENKSAEAALGQRKLAA